MKNKMIIALFIVAIGVLFVTILYSKETKNSRNMLPGPYQERGDELYAIDRRSDQ